MIPLYISSLHCKNMQLSDPSILFGKGSERMVSRRALKVLSSPDSFLKYVLVRAGVAGFPVTPARVEELAKAVSAVPPQELLSQGINPVEYYRDVFASFLAQDAESYERFKKFWDDLWYVEYVPPEQLPAGEGGLDRLADSVVDRILRRMAGTPVSIPPEVIEE